MAHQTLHGLLPEVAGRNFFGISRPNEKGEIIYHAAAEETFEGEGKNYHCKSLALKKGKYISILLKNYLNDIDSIGKAFQLLLKDQRIDPQGYCVEEYVNDADVRCMVRLQNN